MNSLLVASLALAALVLGYVFYGKKVSRWLNLDPDLKPPSEEFRDGVDYVPARHWGILFGHHFASIAGAAPIIGPVIACLYWGWVPALLWIVVGGIFFGAVHDYFSLTASLENKGRSVGDLSEATLGRAAKVVFGIFVMLALILIVAVFAAVAGQTLAGTPQVVIPTFGLIVVAMGVGFLVYKTNVPLLLDTFIGLALLAGLILLGFKVPVSLPVAEPAKWWTVLLLLYGLVASVLPVPVLLQPRDHLAAGVLFFGLTFGFIGVLLSRPPMQSPAVVSFASRAGGPGWLWPMMFVTIACGAISGFHSLVASGTTSKQLPAVRDARRIGYGAMILESALAVLAVIAVTAGLYWKAPPAGLDGPVYQTLMKEGGWMKTFGVGYGRLTAPLFGALGTLIGITMLKTFVMTTLDSATRIARYLLSELVGDTFGVKPFRNRYLATAVVGMASGALALGSWKAIWPVFGSANQLIAALVLIMATAYLLSRRRGWVFVAVPAVLVLVTTIGALIYNLRTFLAAEPPMYMLAGIDVLLLALAVFVTAKGVAVVARKVGAKPGTDLSSQPEEA